MTSPRWLRTCALALACSVPLCACDPPDDDVTGPDGSFEIHEFDAAIEGGEDRDGDGYFNWRQLRFDIRANAARSVQVAVAYRPRWDSSDSAYRRYGISNPFETRDGEYSSSVEIGPVKEELPWGDYQFRLTLRMADTGGVVASTEVRTNGRFEEVAYDRMSSRVSIYEFCTDFLTTDRDEDGYGRNASFNMKLRPVTEVVSGSLLVETRPIGTVEFLPYRTLGGLTFSGNDGPGCTPDFEFELGSEYAELSRHEYEVRLTLFVAGDTRPADAVVVDEVLIEPARSD